MASTRHPLHEPTATYSETNCWVDALIEVLHLRGREPLACLPCAAGIAFEGDQFTFYKPGSEALLSLYGVDIHEMQPYRPLVKVAAEQLDRGRELLIEVDSWWLPDTAATSYRAEHVKTTIGLLSIDPAVEIATYAHNSGVHSLAGEDFRGALRVDVPAGSPLLLPYVELVRWDAGPALDPQPLRAASLGLLRSELARRPADAFAGFTDYLPQVLPELLAGSPAERAGFTFVTLRMAGSAAAVCASYARWMFDAAGADAAERFEQVAQACRALSFRLARGKAFDPLPLLEAAAADWRAGLAVLDGLAH